MNAEHPKGLSHSVRSLVRYPSPYEKMVSYGRHYWSSPQRPGPLPPCEQNPSSIQVAMGLTPGEESRLGASHLMAVLFTFIFNGLREGMGQAGRESLPKKGERSVR